MQLSNKQLLGLPVETRAGIKLGVVKSFAIDTDRQVVVGYTVSTAILPKIIASTLLIRPSQVVDITEKKMVVEDALITDTLVETVPGEG